MSWTTMHFAVGMGCAGAAATATCLYLRRGWRWVPAAMTLGGFWALVPDLPRIWRVDAPWLPLSSILGSLGLEKRLHAWGDIFCGHRWMDDHLPNLALHGLIGILLLYNAAIVLLMWMESRARHQAEQRRLRAPRADTPRTSGPLRLADAPANAPATHADIPPAAPERHDAPAVAGRIGPNLGDDSGRWQGGSGA